MSESDDGRLFVVRVFYDIFNDRLGCDDGRLFVVRVFYDRCGFGGRCSIVSQFVTFRYDIRIFGDRGR